MLGVGLLDGAVSLPSDGEALRAMISAGPCVRAVRHAGEETVAAALLESVAPYRQADGSYRISNAFRFVLATRA